MISEGSKAPDFTLPDQQEKPHRLSDYQGRWVVLYFYPKDNTPGCSQEARDFASLLERFHERGAVVLGVSKDSVQSHRRFAEKLGLGFPLLADPETKVLRAYGAWGKKKLYGKEYEGTIRSTVLIDPEGRVARVWPKVRVKGHAEAVLAELERLQEERRGS